MTYDNNSLARTLSSVWNKVLSWTMFKKEAPVRHIHTKRRAFSPEKQAELEALCTQLFKKKALITSGKLQFIGLAKIKKRMGKQWAGLSQIVYDTAETVMDEYMGKTDVFIRYQDDTYIIIFAHANLEEGRVKATEIAQEIRRRLFALEEEELKDLEILKAIATIKTDSLVHQGFPDFLDELTAGLDAYVGWEEETPPEQEEEAPLTLGDLTGTEIEASYYNAKSDKAAAMDLPAHIGFSYMPLWDVRRSALTTYLCLAHDGEANENPLQSHKALFRGQNGDNRLALDLQMLQSVIAEIGAMAIDGRKLLIACSVQHETLYNFESYETYKTLLDTIPPEQRQFLILMVMTGDQKLPIKNPYWFAKPLKTLCRHVFTEVPLRKDLNFNYLSNVGTDAIGIMMDKQPASEQETMKLLNALALKAKSLKITQSFVLGISTLSLTTMSVCAGFDFLGGPAIHSPVGKPDTIHRYHQENLLAGLAKGSDS